MRSNWEGESEESALGWLEGERPPLSITVKMGASCGVEEVDSVVSKGGVEAEGEALPFPVPFGGIADGCE